MANHSLMLDRRHLLFAAAAIPASSLLQACAGTGHSRRTGEGPDTTHEQTEGPFYRLFSTPRTTLREPGMAGTTLDVSGRVVDKRGKPLANALLDFWQCDDAGIYDTRSYRLRGHQFTDAEGRYQLATIVPGLYPGRTRHIHAKLQPAGNDLPQAPHRLTLTTQMYFPGEPGNDKDEIFDPSLLLAIEKAGEGRIARFDFVLDLG
jgi:protocatechuate 3,4-dioxygenase beta subunit